MVLLGSEREIASPSTTAARASGESIAPGSIPELTVDTMHIVPSLTVGDIVGSRVGSIVGSRVGNDSFLSGAVGVAVKRVFSLLLVGTDVPNGPLG